MRESVLETEDSCERFLADHLASLARAFVAGFGIERGQEALAEAMAYAWEHWADLTEMDNPVGVPVQGRPEPLKIPLAAGTDVSGDLRSKHTLGRAGAASGPSEADH